MKNGLIALSIAMVLLGCGEQSGQPSVVQQVKNQPKTPPHLYSLKDGYEYGYEKALSENDVKDGRAANALMMFKYLGERNGEIELHTKQGEVHVVFLCQRPCEFVKVMTFFNGSMVSKDHIRAAEGSIAWIVTRDAMNGQLERFVRDSNGKREEVWFDENGPKWRTAAPIVN